MAVLVTGVLIWAKPNAGSVLSLLNMGVGVDQIAKDSVDYLNKNVLQQGQTAELVSATKESGVVKMKIKIGGNTYDSYATLDGKLLFPEAFTISPTATAQTNTPPAQTAVVTSDTVTKVEKTMLDAYVVSSCPFGLQMQRALYNAVKTVPSLANYVKVRYIGSISGDKTIAMHGEEEAREDERQICIREEQQDKYWSYVGCYMQKTAGTSAGGMPYGDTKTCQAAAGIDVAKLNSCMTDPNRMLKYAKEDFDLNTKYSVTGSPTLVLNGSVIDETSFGGRSANGIGKIICSSSTTPPSFCQDAQLSTDQAATSFSLTYAGAGATGATANCAPTVQ